MGHWILLLVLYCVAFPIVFLWNGYILFIAACRMQRTASTMLFLNRAVSDFIFILCLPLRFLLISLWHVDWGRELSNIISSLHMFCSAFLLTAISIHHFVLAAWPEWAQKCHTAALAFWVSLGTWALSAGFSFRYSDLWEFLPLPANTTVNFPVDEGRVKTAIGIQFLAGFLIPLVLMFISIFYVIHAARLGGSPLIRAIQPLRILLGLIPSFFLGWMPYHVFFFLKLSATYAQPLLEVGSIFAYTLPYVSSCLNPIFYLTMDKEFLRYQECSCNPDTTDPTALEPAE